MQRRMMKRALVASCITLGIVLSNNSQFVRSAEWSGGASGNWSDVSPTVPGWDTAVPNAPGAVAQLTTPLGASILVTQNTGAAVTLGAINYGNNNDIGPGSWTITNANGITMDSGGAGPATITNSSTTASSLNALIIDGGTLTLNSDLHIINSSTASTTTRGPIQITSQITGSKGITFTNEVPVSATILNSTNFTINNSFGSIFLNTSISGLANTYTGDTTITKGTVAFVMANTSISTTASFNPFGTGTIYLGTPNSSDSAALVKSGVSPSTTVNVVIPNNIVLAANNTGMLAIGGVNNSDAASPAGGKKTDFTGTITLNSDLTIVNKSNTFDSVRFIGKITGPGNVIFPASFAGVSTFSGNLHDYSGNTIIHGGSLITRSGNSIPNGVGKGNLILNAGFFMLGANETINGLSGTGGSIQGSNTTTPRRLTVGDNDVTSTFAGSIINNGNLAAPTMQLNKIGAGTLTLSGANRSSGATAVSAGTIQYALQNSLYNNQVNIGTVVLAGAWNANNIGVAPGATLAFNVGGAGEFTSTDIDLLKDLYVSSGHALLTEGGFLNGSNLGLDTTNAAGGEFAYATPINNTNSGANAIGLKKLGTNKLTLSGTNTYTGNTTVAAGTLNITGSHTTGANYSVASGADLITNNVRVTGALTLDGTATINVNGGVAGASKVETLTVGAGGKLNLKDNDIVVGTGTVANVRTAIKTGVAGAAGITSDLPAFGVTTGFGYALGNDSALSPLLAGNLTGQSYDADSVLVKYTFLGDADLDGDSDLNDLGLWAAAFTGDLGNPVTPVTFWTSGDFDYDGDTDLNDLGFWAGTFTGDLGGGAGSLIVNAPGAPAGAVAALNSMGITVVPEPSTFVLAGVGLVGLAVTARRRRTN